MRPRNQPVERTVRQEHVARQGDTSAQGRYRPDLTPEEWAAIFDALRGVSFMCARDQRAWLSAMRKAQAAVEGQPR